MTPTAQESACALVALNATLAALINRTPSPAGQLVAVGPVLNAPLTEIEAAGDSSTRITSAQIRAAGGAMDFKPPRA